MYCNDRLKLLSTGDRLASPSGRQLKVADIFVPRNHSGKSQVLPSQFRNYSRKVVVFENGAIAPLKEIQNRYQLIA